MPRTLAALLAALLLASACGGCRTNTPAAPPARAPAETEPAPAAAPFTYTSEEDGFSVVLPATHRDVQRETAPMETALGQKTRVTYTAEAGDLLFMVTLVPLPELNMMTAEQQRANVEVFAHALANTGELLSIEPATLAGVPAWSVRYTARVQDYTLHFRATVLYRNAHLYQFQAAALEPELLNSKDADRFLGEFKLL